MTVPLGSPRVLGLAAAPGATTLYTLVHDDSAVIRVIDVLTLTVTGSIDRPDTGTSFSDAASVLVSPDGSHLYIGHTRGVTEVDTATHKVRRTFSWEDGSYFTSLTVSSDSAFLYGGASEKAVQFNLVTS